MRNGEEMHTYRVYSVESSGKITAGQWLEAVSDEQALEKAKGLCSPGAPKVELWHGGRFVCSITCDGEVTIARKSGARPPPS